MIAILVNLLRLVLLTRLWCILVNVLGTLERNMPSSVVGLECSVNID